MRRRVLALLTIAGIAAAAACQGFGEEPVAAPSGSPDGAANDAAGDGDGASAPASCSGTIDAWSAPVPLSLVGPGGEVHFRDPFVTADGLSLYLAHLDGAGWRVFRSTRPSRQSGWEVPTELRGFRAPAYAVPYPSAHARSADEIVAAIASIHTDMGAIVRDGGTWNASLYAELQRPDIERVPTVTADGVTLVYVEVNAPRPNDTFRILLQASRGAPTLASPWDGSKNVASAPDGGSSLPEGFDWPALTPDGLGLFYVTEAAKHRVRYVKRKVRSGSFFVDGVAPVEIADLSAESGYTSRVRSITDDGCEVYLTSDRGGVEEAWMAKRR